MAVDDGWHGGLRSEREHAAAVVAILLARALGGNPRAAFTLSTASVDGRPTPAIVHRASIRSSMMPDTLRDSIRASSAMRMYVAAATEIERRVCALAMGPRWVRVSPRRHAFDFHPSESRLGRVLPRRSRVR